MTLPEPQLAALVRSSKRAAVLSALGALVVFVSLGIGSLKLFQANNDLDEQLAKKHALQQRLDREIEEKQALQRKLDADIQTLHAVRKERDQAKQEKAVAQAEAEDLTDRVAAAPAPDFKELQSVVQKTVVQAAAASDSARDKARAEWRAGLAIRVKDPVAARRHFEAAIEADKGYAAPYNSLGRIAFDNRDFDGAMAYYRAALEREPSYGPALYNLAVTADKQGKRPEARRYAEELRRQHPQDAKSRKLVDTLLSAGSNDMVPLP